MDRRIFLFLTISFLLNWATPLSAKTNFETEYKMKMDSIFEFIDKQQIETGILLEYGLNLIPYQSYNGIPTDTNYVTMSTWKSLYHGLYNSQINNNSNLAEPSTVCPDEANGNVKIMYYSYNQLDPNALEKKWVTFDNEQIRLTDGAPSPFLKKSCFAVAPPQNLFNSNIVSLNFDANDFYTNTGLSITQLEIKCGDNEYESISWNQPWTKGMQEGEHEILFRATFSNGEKLTSHSKITVESQRSVSLSKPIDKIIIPADDKQWGGELQILYLNKNQTQGKFIRPLIIAGDVDFSSAGESYDLNDICIGEIGTALEQLSQIYDIIYIKYNDGFDDLRRNGELFKTALKIINDNRFSISDNSYVLGIGIGGIIARIGINMMELENSQHQIQKFIALNTPFKGVNIPISIQSALRHFWGLPHIIKNQVSDINDHIKIILQRIDTIVMQQLLIYRINDNFQCETSLHDSFMKEAASLLRKPQECESIAISHRGSKTNPLSSLFFSISIRENTFFYKFTANLNGYTTPDRFTDIIYNGNIKLWIKILGIPVAPIKFNQTVNSPNSIMPIDNLGGVHLPLDFIKNALQGINFTIEQDSFCFIPAFSAFDSSDGDKFSISKSKIPFDRYYYSDSNGSYTNPSTLLPFLAEELEPRIVGESNNILGATELSVINMPNFPIINYNWNFKNNNFKILSKSGTNAIVCPLNYKGLSDIATVTPNLIIPIEGIDLSAIGTIEKHLSTAKIEILGDDCIAKDGNYYELSAIPYETDSIIWTASSKIKIQNIDNFSIIAKAIEFEKDQWIKATLYANNEMYEFKKQLNVAKLDDIKIGCLEHWKDSQTNTWKYAFIIEMVPNYPFEYFDYCWDDDVAKITAEGDTITGKYIFIQNAKFFQKGLADIESDGGDVGMCNKKHIGDIVEIPDSSEIIIITPPGFDDEIIHTNSYEPINPPIWGGYEPLGPNTAVVTMPVLSSKETAFGNVYCYVSDQFGNSYKVAYKVGATGEYTPPSQAYSFAPNPANSTITIRKSPSIENNKNTRILIFNDQMLVREKQIQDNITQIDVSDLPNGSYYLNIIEQGKIVSQEIIIVQH